MSAYLQITVTEISHGIFTAAIVAGSEDHGSTVGEQYTVEELASRAPQMIAAIAQETGVRPIMSSDSRKSGDNHRFQFFDN